MTAEELILLRKSGFLPVYNPQDPEVQAQLNESLKSKS